MRATTNMGELLWTATGEQAGHQDLGLTTVSNGDVRLFALAVDLVQKRLFPWQPNFCQLVQQAVSIDQLA
ncbi:MAG: hypothetical protein ACXV3S_01840 [Kineosporiaceae bacterium]